VTEPTGPGVPIEVTVTTGTRSEDGRELPLLWWCPAEPLRAVSTAIVGGGVGPMHWYLNATVPADYGRHDPAEHVDELARGRQLHGPGVGMLTAVDVTTVEVAADGGVVVLATVGLGLPTWAAAPAEPDDTDGATGPPPAGTINLLVVVPEAVSDAALVNLLATATEAKVQALREAGVPGTGTASDAVCVACPTVTRSPATELTPGTDPTAADRARFGGPRSYWGARAARAVHEAVARGTAADHARAVAGGWPRPPRHGG
jgi:adenosylcobinamide amidohydrolase